MYILLTNLHLLVSLTFMKIAVVGCGGNGGLVAGILASKKLDIVCIELIEESVRIIREQGIRLQGKKGSVHARVKAATSFTDEQGKFDIIIIAVKSNVLESVFLEARNHICNEGFIVTLQNGLEILSISEKYPSIKIVAGAVGFNSIMLEYGKYLVTSEGGITIGNLTCAASEDLFLLKGIFEPEIKIDVSNNIKGVLWAKLLIVCGVTGLGGVAGLLLGDLLKYRVSRKLFYKIVTEGVLVAHKLGIRIVKFSGGINPERFGDHKCGYPLFLRWLLLKIAGLKNKNVKSNIQRDLEKGKKTEVDYINGKVVEIGETVGIDAPVNRKVVEIVKEIEEKKRDMSPKNLYEIWETVCKPD